MCWLVLLANKKQLFPQSCKNVNLTLRWCLSRILSDPNYVIFKFNIVGYILSLKNRRKLFKCNSISTKLREETDTTGDRISTQGRINNAMNAKTKVSPSVNMVDGKSDEDNSNAGTIDSKTELYNLKLDDSSRSASSRFTWNVFCAPETSFAKIFVAISACGFAGLVFGWCMEKSRGKPETMALMRITFQFESLFDRINILFFQQSQWHFPFYFLLRVKRLPQNYNSREAADFLCLEKDHQIIIPQYE